MQKLAVALGFVTGLGAGQARADIVKQQAPCSSACATLTSGTGGIFTIRSVAFTAPGRGNLILFFHGQLICQSSVAALRTILVNSQIVEDEAIPDAGGPSGLELFASLEGAGRSLSFNLASHRVFRINAAGTFTYRFRAARSIPTNVECTVENGTFLTHFVE
jgi:hypothetical protein